MTRRLLITGGAGFIGSNLVHHLVKADPNAEFIILDKLTYAGNKAYLGDVLNLARITFEVADIADYNTVRHLFKKHQPTGVYHLAAESHVDRSITGPADFIHSNIVGTFNLLECARHAWAGEHNHRFLHVSTDEVFGTLGEDGAFTEDTHYDPSSPYSASKAASDHLVRAYHRTYDLNVVVTNCSNNFGPHQYPEKLIPVMIRNIRDQRPLPVYGDGKNVRDWLYVVDHCRALHTVFEQGESGRSYNIGTENEWTNIALVEFLCDAVDAKLGRAQGTGRKLISFVKDRLGHDLRYAIDPSRIRNELDWTPSFGFEQAMELTISWYLEHFETMWGV